MSFNPPTFGQGANVYNYNGNRTFPVTLGAYNLMLHENYNRQITDTTTSHVLNHDEPSFEVTYTFQPEAQQFALRGFQQQQQQLQQPQVVNQNVGPLEYQIALKELEKQCLETMLLREKMLSNPYVLKFTENAATLTDPCCECRCSIYESTGNNVTQTQRVSFSKFGTSEETAQTSDIGLPPIAPISQTISPNVSSVDCSVNSAMTEEDQISEDSDDSIKKRVGKSRKTRKKTKFVDE